MALVIECADCTCSDKESPPSTMKILLSVFTLSIFLLSGCATVDQDIVGEVAAQRIVATELLRPAGDISEAGGMVGSMSKGIDSATFRVLTDPSRVKEVVSVLQSADILGMGGMQQNPGPATGKVLVIAGAGLNPPKTGPWITFAPVAAGDWQKQVDAMNTIAMDRS